MSVPLTTPSGIRSINIELLDDVGNMAATVGWRGYIGIVPVDYVTTTAIPTGHVFTDYMADVESDRDDALAALGYTDT